jgi:hypothetical protein
MTNNFITNTTESITLKDRLQKLISASSELKFLVGFFYFSGWQEIYQKLFEQYGGEKIQLVESLNDHPMWVEALKKMVMVNI